MTITYQEIEIVEMNTKYIERTSEDGSISIIPFDSANSDYQAYLKSLEEQANDQSL